MTDTVRWIPFTLLTFMVVVSSGFWKIEKSRELPLKPAAEMAKAAPNPVMEGKPAPQFTLPLFNGGDISLANQTGKMVFLNVWATWCLPCKEEMPSMERLYRKLKPYDFEMIAISIDENVDDVKKFVEELGLTFPIAMDTKQQTIAKYRITGVPETFMISASGVVMHHIIGPADWDNPQIVNALAKAAGVPQAEEQASGKGL